MYLDLIASDNSITVNKQFIRIAGIQAATYWAELMNVFRKVCIKKTYDERAFFKLDRKYISEQTTITPAEQYKCDITLTTLGVLLEDSTDNDKIAVDIQRFVELVTCEDTSILRTLKKEAKPKRGDTAAAKKIFIIQSLKNGLTETNPEVRTALENWIEAMVQKSVLSKVQITTFESQLNSYTSDPVVKKQLLEIATMNGWRELQWSIERYEKNYKNSNIVGQQRVSTGLDDSISF